MEFVCTLLKEQRDMLSESLHMWLGQRGFEEYRTSFRVVKSVLSTDGYFKKQLPYINNVRDWYIAQKKGLN